MSTWISKSGVLCRNARLFSSIMNSTTNTYYSISKPCAVSCRNLSVCRSYSQNVDPANRVYLPQLMDAPIDPLPSLRIMWTRLKAEIKAKEISQDFQLLNFIEGARKAFCVISNALADKEYDALQGLVTDDVINILKARVETFSNSQRDLLRVKEDNILVCDPYDINVVHSSDSDERTVAIAVYAAYVCNSQSTIKILGRYDIPWSFIFCNYRFIRTFCKQAQEGSWIVDLVNHISFDEYDRVLKQNASSNK